MHKQVTRKKLAMKQAQWPKYYYPNFLRHLYERGHCCGNRGDTDEDKDRFEVEADKLKTTTFPYFYTAADIINMMKIALCSDNTFQKPVGAGHYEYTMLGSNFIIGYKYRWYGIKSLTSYKVVYKVRSHHSGNKTKVITAFPTND